MPKVLISLFLGLLVAFPLYAEAGCNTKEDICSLMKTLDHFSILNKCPGAGPLLAECKKSSGRTFEPLPAPEFVANGNGTVTDKANHLLWMQTGINQKFSLKTAEDYAVNSEDAGQIGWRIPSLRELSSLLQNHQSIGSGGSKSWIHPQFNDQGEYYYWTTTTCEEVSVIEDRYQKKICQQGPTGAWLLNFKAGAIIWHFAASEKFYAWMVKDLE